MVDVRVLFDYGLLGRNIAAVGFIVTLILMLAMTRRLRWILGVWRIMSIVCLAAIATLGVLIALDFSHAFVIFHEIFFVDNWSFDPRTNLMVNMLPTPFWENITAFIIIMFVSLLVLLIVATSVLRKVLARHER